MTTLSVLFYLMGGIVLEQVVVGGVKRLSGVTSTISTRACLRGMAQQGLGNRHVLMDARRMVALSGVVVALKAK